MTEGEKRIAYLEWIKDYCQNDFKNADGIEKIPAMIDLVIDELIAHDSNTKEVQSESLGDYSVTFSQSDIGYPKKTLAKLKPYIKRKVKFI